ncbi:hypothetical protein EYR38_008780 [Pleurotus pulmonarius]|nr:hypothetical protein EYR38_008780 [Pleurotus pulmonarius]
MPPSSQRTPLRRISHGSLFALSRSGAYPDAPHGLGFIEPAMSEFVDEAESLQVNVEAMKNLSDSLATFNESFASWLYVMQMNSLTTDWPQAPTNASFVLAKERAERNAIAALEAAKAAKAAQYAREAEKAAAAAADKTTMTAVSELETTFVGNTTTNVSAQSTKVVKKKVAKPKLTAREKKERSMEIEKVILSLPLEFRGNDPNLRRNMESVIEGMMDAKKGLKILDLVKVPDLPQARVNKCLIALVNRKIVRKDNSTGTLLYHWQGAN